MKKTILTLLLILVVLGRWEYGQQTNPQQHETTVRLVLVDVLAVDEANNPVTDLSLGDFEVFEDGKRITLNSLDLINFQSLSEDRIQEHEGIIRKKRFFVIFDSINTIRRMLNREKAKIITKLNELIQAGGEIMIFEMNESGGIQALQSFTSDPELIAQAVDRASGSIWVERATDDLVYPIIAKRLDVKSKRGGSSSVDLSEGIKETSMEVYQYRSRLRFEKSLSSMLSLMNIIKEYPGRKPVLLVSGGFPAVTLEEIMQGEGILDRDFPSNIKKDEGITSKIGHADLKAAKIFDPFKVLQKGGRRYGDDIFGDLIRYANSHNITFYTMDPDSYLRYVLPDITEVGYPSVISTARIKDNELKNLKYMALDTGGTALQGAKKFDNFSKNVNRDLISYYELSYYPKRKKADGKYHKITVKVKRPDIKIRFRKGYFDYKPEQRESLLFASSSLNPGLFQEIDFQARIIPFVIDKDYSQLWINMVIPVQDVILGGDPYKEYKLLKANLWVDDGKGKNALDARIDIPFHLTPSFRSRLKLARYFGFNTCSDKINLKDQKYRVVFSLFDEESSRLGTVEQELIAPALKKDQDMKIINAVFGRIIEAHKKGKNFTLSRKDGTLFVDKHLFHPMGTNQFQGKEKISLFMQIDLSQKPKQLEPEFRLFQNGMELGGIMGNLVKNTWNKKAGIQNMLYQLDFSAFPRGDYDLRIILHDPTTGIQTEKSVPVKIL